jgi:hypothetical protein
MTDAGDSVKDQCTHEKSIRYRLRKQFTRCERIESMDEVNSDRDWVAVLVIMYELPNRNSAGDD